jgi:hypothetical protein
METNFHKTLTYKTKIFIKFMLANKDVFAIRYENKAKLALFKNVVTKK